MGGVLESRSLNESWRELALQNAAHTYVELARAVPDARLQQRYGGWLCSANFEMAFCNFAIGLNFGDESTTKQTLRELSNFFPKGRSFRVFTLVDRPSKRREELFKSQGYKVQGKLVHMISSNGQTSAGNDTIASTSPSDRLITAEFMARQFFWRQSPDQRLSIARATAQSVHRLERLEIRGTMVGAMMLSETPRAWGLYNVCVANEFRYQGFGASIVQSAQRLAQVAGVPLFLQCDASLKAWYYSLGFAENGFIESYVLNAP